MRFWMAGVLAFLGATGCRHAVVFGDDTGETDTGERDSAVDTATDSDTADSGYEECTDVEVDPAGPKHPIVGDVWVIWLSCNGARLVGPMVIAWDPVDFVLIDSNAATFQMAGTATVSVTSGRADASLDVEVLPADTGDTGDTAL